LRDELTRGLSAFLDDALLSTTAANAATGAPAGLLNAEPRFGSAGSSTANVHTDVVKLIGDFSATNPGIERMAIVMSPGTAARVALATAAPDSTMDGGHLFGVPAFTSPAAGANLIAVDLSAIVIADNDELNVDLSQQASVELSTTPTSPVVSGTVHVSLWPLGLVGLRCRRYLNWKRARTSAILYTTTSY